MSDHESTPEQSDETLVKEENNNNNNNNIDNTSDSWYITNEVHKIKQWNESNGGKPKKLGVTWQNLTVRGISSDVAFNGNVISQFNPFGESATKNAPIKAIIDNSSGCVKPGEMLLVLVVAARAAHPY
jgi:hypothetical protein